MWRLHVSPSFHHFLIPPPSPRLPQRVSERLVEGALVRGSRWKPLPAEGPWRPAAAGHCGATERCRGGDGRPRPQASLLLLHPAVRQRTRFSRGTILSSCLQLGWFCWVISDVWKEMRQKVNVHGDDTPTFLWKPSNVCVCVCVSMHIRPAARRIWAAGWVCCLQRPAAPLSLKSSTMTTSTWTRSLTYGTQPETPSCESLPAEYVCVFLRVFIRTSLSVIAAFILKSICVCLSVFSSQMGHHHCSFLQQRLNRLQDVWRCLRERGEET